MPAAQSGTVIGVPPGCGLTQNWVRTRRRRSDGRLSRRSSVQPPQQMRASSSEIDE